MKGNGILKLIGNMVKVVRYGLMEVCIKDIGLMINVMVTVGLYMLMVQFMKANGKMIKLMEMENNTPIMKEPNILVSGNKICSMVRVEKYGLMVMNSKDHISVERKMVKVNLSGRTNLHMMVNLKIITYME